MEGTGLGKSLALLRLWGDPFTCPANYFLSRPCIVLSLSCRGGYSPITVAHAVYSGPIPVLVVAGSIARQAFAFDRAPVSKFGPRVFSRHGSGPDMISLLFVTLFFV